MLASTVFCFFLAWIRSTGPFVLKYEKSIRADVVQCIFFLGVRARAYTHTHTHMHIGFADFELRAIDSWTYVDSSLNRSVRTHALQQNLNFSSFNTAKWYMEVKHGQWEKKTNSELRESMGIEKISDVGWDKWGMCWGRRGMIGWRRVWRWLEGCRGRGKPKMTWEKVVNRDMKVRGLVINDAKNGVKWRALSWGAKG